MDITAAFASVIILFIICAIAWIGLSLIEDE